MPWTWGNARFASGGYRNDSAPAGGGRIGSVSEAGEKSTWPEYDAQYLKHALNKADRKYSTAGLFDKDGQPDETMRQIYLQQTATNYKQEAEQALKHEFDLWLQGRHPANNGDNMYLNGEGRPSRRWAFQSSTQGGPAAGATRDGWRHTNWGKAELTHLPGVRDYLRYQYEEGLGDEIKMNLLADYGPQDLEQAWKYFKHWVKGRAVSDATPLVLPRNEGRDMRHKSLAFGQQPYSMDNEMDTQQLQGTRQVTGDDDTHLPVYGRRQTQTSTADGPEPDPSAVDVWHARLERMQRAADEINERRAAGLASNEEVDSARRHVQRVENEEEGARVAEFKDNINSQARQAAAVRDELQNDATHAGLEPGRDSAVLDAQEAGTKAYLSDKAKQVDLAAASISKIQADLKAERVEVLPVSGPDAIVSRPWWPTVPRTVF
jgi:hypothetical protein